MMHDNITRAETSDPCPGSVAQRLMEIIENMNDLGDVPGDRGKDQGYDAAGDLTKGEIMVSIAEMTESTIISEAVRAAIRDAARGMAREFGLDELQSRLLAFPAKIRQQKETVKAARDALIEAEQALREADAFLLVAITQEVNGDGKPAFSNEKAREAELIRRRKIDAAYQQALRQHQAADAALRTAQADLEHLEDDFKAHRTALEAAGNLLRAIGQ